MGWVIALVLIAGVVALDVAMLNNANVDEIPDASYARSVNLFNPAERSFLQVLDQVVGGNARIFGKVCVADVVVPGEGVTVNGWKKAYRKVSGSRFDFVLCDRNDLSVICAIALEHGNRHPGGRSHSTATLGEVCHAAGVPLIHVPAGITAASDEVRKLLAPHLGPYPSTGSDEV
jgi:hypothetical protein